MVKFSILALALCGSAAAFAPMPTSMAGPNTANAATRMQMSVDNEEGDSRRSFFSRVAGSAAMGAMAILQAPMPAFAANIKTVNARLVQYGVPPIPEVPKGFSPLAEVWGKGKNRDPLLVSFVYPTDWIVTLPSQDINGEDGTIQAGEYGKGDTSTFFVYSDEGKIDNIASQSKDFFQRAIIKSISQKGNNVYQNFKTVNIVPQTVNGQEYMIVDFKYELLTGAGFEVDRRGVASVTSVGGNVEVLWCASTRQRYKKTEEQLRTIAGSFRCYADGLGSSKIVYEDRDN
mmetsp:Transcript_28796/g.44022  ORF Transcript_28796/g.44022 Transcript_28796/m.44022 type:complete len:288 (-) Transcript_28796:223-1086(-)|eukprot:CAMPEP_0194085574 /NCGR_PEP_ID=MMETSP0149-20130528/17974_1 /TAXON_ID=122233 /ORGANISM="Chaetoceros debilis, Strain MM31A-1" /LENGTH=287 /DNA_ID=CAMNT_0038768487 /DNA_START=53 /DNA_END=916 /DNA_ORIENTATION=+